MRTASKSPRAISMTVAPPPRTRGDARVTKANHVAKARHATSEYSFVFIPLHVHCARDVARRQCNVPSVALTDFATLTHRAPSKRALRQHAAGPSRQLGLRSASLRTNASAEPRPGGLGFPSDLPAMAPERRNVS